MKVGALATHPSRSKLKKRGAMKNEAQIWLRLLSVGAAWLLLPIAVASAADMPADTQITAEQAASLPDNELARLVLGNVGTLVLHVERPTWTSSAPLPHTGAPPLRLLTFDLKAEDRWAGGWSGMCQAQRIFVSFNSSGQPVSLSARILSGTAGQLIRTTVQQSAAVKPCSRLKTLESFFETWNGPQDGDDTIPAIQQIANYLEKPFPLPFSLTCKLDKLTVPCRRRDWEIRVNEIDGITKQDCGAGNQRRATARMHCFNVSLARSVRGRSYRFPFVTFVIKDQQTGEPKVVSAQLGMGSGRTEPFF